MTANVETMMYAGQTPWHGLGVHVGDLAVTAQEAIVASGLDDWHIEQRPLQYPGPGFQPVAAGNGMALVRVNRPGTPAFAQFGAEVWFANQTKAYNIVQNRDAFDWVDKYGLKVETAGSLLEGRKIWILCPINGTFQPTAGDEHKAYLLFAKGHDGKMGNVVKLVIERVVCCNTLAVALSEKGIQCKASHRKNVMARLDDFGQLVGLVEKKVSDYAALATMLAGKVMTAAAWDEFALQIVPNPVKRPDGTLPSTVKAENKRSVLHKLFNSGRGNAGKTAFDALNAVTEWTNYHSVPSQDQSKRLDSAWFGRGDGLNQQAVQVLQNMYA